jgi:hypothetical protein
MSPYSIDREPGAYDLALGICVWFVAGAVISGMLLYCMGGRQ